MSEHGGCGQADLPRLPRALMIISLDFEQFSARLFAAAHARIWPISNVRELHNEILFVIYHKL